MATQAAAIRKTLQSQCNSRKLKILNFDNSQHRNGVVSLWKEVFGYEADHNVPELVIDKKLEANDELLFVAIDNKEIIGSIMAGYDGHRGWIYSLAVSPKYRNKGLGSQLLTFAEKRLTEIGCMKINLQILSDNKAVEEFYHANGYKTEERISMGKKLQENITE